MVATIPDKDESMDNNSQQNSGGRVSDAGQGVSKLVSESLGEAKADKHQVGDDIPSTEIHEGEHISYRGDNEVIAADTSSSKLSRQVSHENTVTTALIPSAGTDTAAMTKTVGPALTTMTPLAFDVTAAKTPSSIEVVTMINPSTETHEPESILDCYKVPNSNIMLLTRQLMMLESVFQLCLVERLRLVNSFQLGYIED